MYNYFTKPLTLFKEESSMAERNPIFCDSVSIVSSASETKICVVDRTMVLPSFTEDELETEIWKQIEDFPRYLVSNLGRVYSTFSEKILRPHISPSTFKRGGNPHIFLYGEKRICISISSLMGKYYFDVENTGYELGEIDSYIIHKNNNVFDNRQSNLIVTHNKTLKKYAQSQLKKVRENYYFTNIKLSNLKSLLYVFKRNNLTDMFISEIENGKISNISVQYKGEKFVLYSAFDKSPFKYMALYFRQNGDKSGEKFKSSFVCPYEYNDSIENHVTEFENKIIL